MDECKRLQLEVQRLREENKQIRVRDTDSNQDESHLGPLFGLTGRTLIGVTGVSIELSESSC